MLLEVLLVKVKALLVKVLLVKVLLVDWVSSVCVGGGKRVGT